MSLADHITRRMAELGVNSSQLHKSGAFNRFTLANILNGKPAQPATLRKLDVALRWEPGSAQRASQGGQPTPLPESAEHPAVLAVRDVLPALKRAVERLESAINGTRPRILPKHKDEK